MEQNNACGGIDLEFLLDELDYRVVSRLHVIEQFPSFGRVGHEPPCNSAQFTIVTRRYAASPGEEVAIRASVSLCPELGHRVSDGAGQRIVTLPLLSGHAQAVVIDGEFWN